VWRQVRAGSGIRIYGGAGQESDRSQASSSALSLGAQIVARSRHNQPPKPTSDAAQVITVRGIATTVGVAWSLWSWEGRFETRRGVNQGRWPRAGLDS